MSREMTGDGSLSWNRSEKFQENQVNFNIKLYDTKQDTEPSLVIYTKHLTA